MCIRDRLTKNGFVKHPQRRRKTLMKTLRKGSEFKRVKNKTQDDYASIKRHLAEGWKYCDKATWKREVRDKK